MNHPSTNSGRHLRSVPVTMLFMACAAFTASAENPQYIEDRGPISATLKGGPDSIEGLDIYPDYYTSPGDLTPLFPEGLPIPDGVID